MKIKVGATVLEMDLDQQKNQKRGREHEIDQVNASEKKKK